MNGHCGALIESTTTSSFTPASSNSYRVDQKPQGATVAPTPGKKAPVGMISIRDLRARASETSPGARDRARLAVENEIDSAVRASRLSPLTAERIKAGLTQAQLAARLDKSQPQIAKWERSSSFEAISLGNLRVLAAALGIELSALTGDRA